MSRSAESLREYEMLKALRQEHIVRLHEAYLHNDFVVLVLEKLYGENVVRSLSLKNRYNEHTVTVIIKQVTHSLHSTHCCRVLESAHPVSVRACPHHQRMVNGNGSAVLHSRMLQCSTPSTTALATVSYTHLTLPTNREV